MLSKVSLRSFFFPDEAVLKMILEGIVQSLVGSELDLLMQSLSSFVLLLNPLALCFVSSSVASAFGCFFLDSSLIFHIRLILQLDFRCGLWFIPCPSPSTLNIGFCFHSRIYWFSSIFFHLDFPSGSDGKASACNAGDLGSIPGSGRSPGEGNGNPLQYSFPGESHGRGAWPATVCGVVKSQTRLSD